MIQSFKSRALRRFFEQGDESRIRADHREKVSDILARLNAAVTPEDMNLPGFKLHRLKGEFANYWAVTVRANWRIIFRFDEGDAFGVDYLDYH